MIVTRKKCWIAWAGYVPTASGVGEHVRSTDDLPSERFFEGGVGREARQFFLDTLQANDLQVGGSVGTSQMAAWHQDTP